MAKVFIDGIMVEPPRDNAPEFVKGRISINLEKFIASAQQHLSPKGWLNMDILESKKGGWYTTLNEWKPLEKPANIAAPKTDPELDYPQDEINPDDIPF